MVEGLLHSIKLKMQKTRHISKISLHGTQFLGDSDTSTCQKLFWLCVMMTGFTALTFMAIEIKNDFDRKNTKIELDSGHYPLDEVVFPGVTICSYNHYRQSFILWLHDLLIESGTFKSSLIEDGVWRPMTPKEITFQKMLHKAFYSGSKEKLTEDEEALLNQILENHQVKEYFKSFVQYVNQSSIQFTDSELLLTPRIVDEKYPVDDKRLIRSFMVQMSGQWDLHHRFISVEWHGSRNQSQQLLKFNPVLASSQGICSFLGPLPQPDDDKILSWPTGVIPGTSNFSN